MTEKYCSKNMEFRKKNPFSEYVVDEQFCQYELKYNKKPNCKYCFSEYCLNHRNKKRLLNAIENDDLENLSDSMYREFDEDKSRLISILSEAPLAKDWNKPSEEKAWKSL